MIIANNAEGRKALGYQNYPLLEHFFPGIEWKIISTPISDDAALEERKTATPALRWVKDDKFSDLEIPGVTEEDFFRITGISSVSKKGETVRSKRISRVMRPFFMWGFFEKGELDIVYRPSMDTKTHDGAMIVGRQALLKMIPKLSRELPARKRRQLENYLRTTTRIEVTILSDLGEDKGHATVRDDIQVDFVLPLDTKTEVKMDNGQILIGFQPVKSHDHLWLDIQSLINLVPFFPLDNLMEWLVEEGDLYLDSIRSGEVDKLYDRISSNPEMDVQGWHLMEYMASGGHAMWFSSIVKSIAGQFIRMVERRSLEGFRCPVPGGRYYVFVDEVGGKVVQPGHILLENESAWVSSADWNELSRIWGGADQDDALPLVPFIDYDGQKKVLAWRNPNQLGEYAVLLVQGDIPWAKWPQLDSRNLPPRIDCTEYKYLVEQVQSPAFAPTPYNLQTMTEAIYVARKNIGTLGMYVNVLMIMKAIWGCLNQELPVRLEDVIDAIVKTGADVQFVKEWVHELAERWISAGVCFPRILAPRVSGMVSKDSRENIKISTTNWLDELGARFQDYLQKFSQQRDELAAQCMPPLAVFEFGQKHLEEAALLRKLYSRNMRQAISTNGQPTEEDFFRIARECEAFLLNYPPHDVQNILAGVMVRTYLMGDDVDPTSDAVAWQLGEKLDGGKRLPGIAQMTLDMLRNCGVIADLETIDGERIRLYRKEANTVQPLRISGVWMAYTQALYKQYEQAEMGQVQPEIRAKMKHMVRDWAAQGKFNDKFSVVLVRDRKVLMRNGRIVGYLHKNNNLQVGDIVQIVFATSEDGNLLVLAEESHAVTV